MSTPALLSADNTFLLVQSAFKAISTRRNLTGEGKEAFYQQAWDIVAGFGPVDAPRAMLIGQSLVLNEMLADAAADAFKSGYDDAKLAARASYATVYRAFNQNQSALTRLTAKAEAAAAAPKAARPKAPEPAPSAEPEAPAEPTAAGQTPVEAQPVEAQPVEAQPVEAQPSRSVEPESAKAASHAPAEQDSTARDDREPEQCDAEGQWNQDNPEEPLRGPLTRRGHKQCTSVPEVAET